MSLSRYVVQLHRKALETLRNERSREIQSNCFQAGFYFESCCFYQRFEKKSLKAPVVGFFFQGYHKRYFLFLLTLCHLCSQLQKDLNCTWGRRCQNSHFSLQNLYHLSSSEIMILKVEYSDKNLRKMTILLWPMLPVTKGENVCFRQFLMNSL